MVLATQAGSGLTAALKPELVALVKDLRERLEGDAPTLAIWQRQHREALNARRSAASWTDWSEDQLTQAAVGWILASVFVRFCEDNRLLGGHPGSRSAGVWITSNDSARRSHAQDAESAFYRAHSDFSYREWLETAFQKLATTDATRELVGEHSAINIGTPSSDAINRLLTFWRKTDDNDSLTWDFQDPNLSTRFLGDLYQDLSEYAKDKYALLQTPEFVEEFILDQTLEPALKDRPLEGFKLIDPTCGSGHFLLGAFQRLLNRWHDAAPGLDVQKRVDLALDSVFGVDLNPFAVAIARFRLIIAALQACELVTLFDAPEFKIHVAVGDSLLHGESQMLLTAENEAAIDVDVDVNEFAYPTEDLVLLRRILVPEEYDVVVGNPPYITVRDKSLSLKYRERYRSCYKTYSMTVPMMERFFGLARTGQAAGWVGQITSNSFLKRAFGKLLVENFLPKVDVRLIVDSEGVYIPGHNTKGTPTMILVGRNTGPSKATIQAAVSTGLREKKGGAGLGQGPAWLSIVGNLNRIGYADKWTEIRELDRKQIAIHPAVFGSEVSEALVDELNNGRTKLGQLVLSIGYTGQTNCDDVFLAQSSAFNRAGIQLDLRREYVTGRDVRDFAVASQREAIFPYDADGNLRQIDPESTAGRFMWPFRTVLWARITFDGSTYRESGRKWWQWHQVSSSKLNGPGITWPMTSSGVHFAFLPTIYVHNRHASVVSLNAGSNNDDFYRLASVLNSSVACFWLRSVSLPKGGAIDRPWTRTYEFTGTNLEKFPVASIAQPHRIARITQLAQSYQQLHPSRILSEFGPDTLRMTSAATEQGRLRKLMIFEQEELDWYIYWAYGLVDESAIVHSEVEEPVVLGISVGQRAFEIALARDGDRRSEFATWFESNDAEVSGDLPCDLPGWYQDLISRRLRLLDESPFLRLLERPEYKRQWAIDSLSDRIREAMQEYVLGRLENRSFWYDVNGMPRARSVSELASSIETGESYRDLITAIDQWAGRTDSDLNAAIDFILGENAVPYLSSLRYSEDGLRKRSQWEICWNMQRAEDAGMAAESSMTALPPEYRDTDFARPVYWALRGKLDVAKETFISYPGAGPVTDPSPLYGWAGWNYAEQALVLGRLQVARSNESFDPEVLTPLVAGVAELLPWIYQWHSGIDPELGTDLAEYFDGQIDDWVSALGKVREDLPKWRPTAPVKQSRARKPKAAISASAAETDGASTASADLISIMGEHQ